jgi:hypothetical protein
MGNKCGCMRLRVLPLGIAFGLLSGLCMLVFAWAAWRFGYGTGFMLQYASIYPGYTSTLVGGIAGFAWGFFEGFICGALLAWFYNLCLCCGSCASCCCAKPKQ